MGSQIRHMCVFVLSSKYLRLPRTYFALYVRCFGEMKTVKTACGLVGPLKVEGIDLDFMFDCEICGSFNSARLEGAFFPGCERFFLSTSTF